MAKPPATPIYNCVIEVDGVQINAYIPFDKLPAEFKPWPVGAAKEWEVKPVEPVKP